MGCLKVWANKNDRPAFLGPGRNHFILNIRCLFTTPHNLNNLNSKWGNLYQPPKLAPTALASQVSWKSGAVLTQICQEDDKWFQTVNVCHSRDGALWLLQCRGPNKRCVGSRPRWSEPNVPCFPTFVEKMSCPNPILPPPQAGWMCWASKNVCVGESILFFPKMHVFLGPS